MAATVSGISAANSSATPLAALGQFTGTALDCTFISSLSVGCYSDKAYHLSIDASADGSSWYLNTSVDAVAGVPIQLQIQPVLKYARVHVVNGSDTQTVLQLQTKYIVTGSGATTAQSNLYAYNGSSEVPVLCDTSGNLTLAHGTSSISVYGSGGQLSTDGSGKVIISQQSSIVTQPAAASVFRSLSITTAGQVAKASAGTLYSIVVSNSDTTDCYFKVYDKSTPPSSTDTPILTLAAPYPISPGGTASSYVYTFTFPQGILFSSGIAIRGSTQAADNANVSNAANTVIAHITFA